MYFDERDFNMEYENINNENDIQNKNWNIDTINIVNMGRNNELYSENEGLNKGNMFKNLYNPYKNYIFKIVVTGKKDELLHKLQELNFKMTDLSLYLDLNKDDIDIYNEFKKTALELKQNKELFEREYGPLCMNETLLYDNYKWPLDPWPWIRGDK